MRKRMIDPAFWSDEKIGNLSPQARLLFIASWNLADDEGILPLRPEYLRSTVFMYDNYGIGQVTTWLKELTDQKLIMAYKSNDQSFGIITNFLKHQVINKPQPSKLPKPLPEDYRTTTVVLPPNIREENIREKNIREGDSKGKHTTFETLEEKDLVAIAEDYGVPESFVRSKKEDLRLYLARTGKTYKDYYAALQTWTRNDAKKQNIMHSVRKNVPDPIMDNMTPEQVAKAKQRIAEIKAGTFLKQI